METMTQPTLPAHGAESLADVIRRHQAGVWRYLRILGCSPNRADDLMQDCFVVVLEREFEHLSDAQTASFLRKTARNLFLSDLRKHGKEVTSDQLDFVEASEEVWLDYAGEDQSEVLRDALAGCMGSLTKRAQKALKLRYASNASRDEISQALDMKPLGVKTLLRRSRDGLRECVKRRLGWPPESELG